MRLKSDRSVITFQLTLLAIAVTITLALTMRTGSEEKGEYEAIIMEAMNQNLPSQYRADQKREGIYRELFLVHGGKRLKTRITADNGILSLNQEGGAVGFTERLENLKCLMQEELFFEDGHPMQRLRLVESRVAYYNYKTNTLTTNEMTFSRFTAPAHDLPVAEVLMTPTMTGRAASAIVTFEEAGPKFHAERLHVSLPQARRS